MNDIYNSVNPPAMPDVLPPLVELLTRNVPSHLKPCVATAVFPALATHLNNVRFLNTENTLSPAALMAVVVGEQASGKSCIKAPIEAINADIRIRDLRARERLLAWQEDCIQKGANARKKQRPRTCIQLTQPDMTNAVFVQRLHDSAPRTLFTLMDELEMLESLQTNGRQGKLGRVSPILRAAFDQAEYGQERAGAQSVTAVVNVRWNWVASTTVATVQDFFRGREQANGTLSRINLGWIQPQMCRRRPVYGTYDDAWKAELEPYIEQLNSCTGNVDCVEANALAMRLDDEAYDFSILSENKAFESFSHRAIEIGFRKSVILYIANGMRWDSTFDDFILWSVRHDLWVKLQLFGETIRQELSRVRMAGSRGPVNLLSLLGETFTREDYIRMRQSRNEPSKPETLRTWKHRHFITESSPGLYHKVV